MEHRRRCSTYSFYGCTGGADGAGAGGTEGAGAGGTDAGGADGAGTGGADGTGAGGFGCGATDGAGCDCPGAGDVRGVVGAADALGRGVADGFGCSSCTLAAHTFCGAADVPVPLLYEPTIRVSSVGLGTFHTRTSVSALP